MPVIEPVCTLPSKTLVVVLAVSDQRLTAQAEVAQQGTPMIGFQRGFDFTTVDLMPAAESSGQSMQPCLGISHIQPPCYSVVLGCVRHLIHAWLARAKDNLYDF